MIGARGANALFNPDVKLETAGLSCAFIAPVNAAVLTRGRMLMKPSPTFTGISHPASVCSGSGSRDGLPLVRTCDERPPHRTWGEVSPQPIRGTVERSHGRAPSADGPRSGEHPRAAPPGLAGSALGTRPRALGSGLRSRARGWRFHRRPQHIDLGDVRGELLEVVVREWG